MSKTTLVCLIVGAIWGICHHVDGVPDPEYVALIIYQKLGNETHPVIECLMIDYAGDQTQWRLPYGHADHAGDENKWDKAVEIATKSIGYTSEKVREMDNNKEKLGKITFTEELYPGYKKQLINLNIFMAKAEDVTTKPHNDGVIINHVWMNFNLVTHDYPHTSATNIEGIIGKAAGWILHPKTIHPTRPIPPTK